MMKTVLALVATSALAVKLLLRLGRRPAHRMAPERHQQRDDVCRWEAEGGNLPAPETTRASVPVSRRARRR